MKRYYRVNVADNMWNGEGWSVNEFYEQPFIIGIPKEATGEDIITTLKKENLLRKRFRYEVEEVWSDEFFIYYLTDFQCVLNMRIIHEENLERQKGYRYGISGKPTRVIEVKAKKGGN